jgi:STE24 endopeptidase
MLKFNLVSGAFLAVYLSQLLFCLWLERLNRNHLRRFGNRVPEPLAGMIGESDLARINAYSLDRSRLFQVQKIIIDFLVLALVVLGFFPVLDRFCSGPGASYLWAGWIFFLVIVVIFFAVDLPFEYFETFVLEEKYGFNKSDLRTWVIDNVKGAMVSVALLTLLLEPLLWAIETFPNYWWFWGFVLTAGLQLVLVVLYPLIVAPIFNKFDPLKDELLAEKVEALISGLGIRSEGIFQMDAGRRSTHSNAYFTGLGKTKRVVLFDTLINSHTHDEILAVLAHEVGHYRLKHIIRSYIAAQFMMLAGFYATYLLMNWGLLYETFGVDPSRSYVSLAIIGIFWKKIGFFLQPALMALSRRHEKEADAFAAKVRPGPAPLILALKKLACHNLSNLVPHPLYVWFNYSHPPLLERVRRLELMASASQPSST